MVDLEATIKNCPEQVRIFDIDESQLNMIQYELSINGEPHHVYTPNSIGTKNPVYLTASKSVFITGDNGKYKLILIGFNEGYKPQPNWEKGVLNIVEELAGVN